MDFTDHVSYSDSKPCCDGMVEQNQNPSHSYADHIQYNILSVSRSGPAATNTLGASNPNPKGVCKMDGKKLFDYSILYSHLQIASFHDLDTWKSLQWHQNSK
jgi:hypothetical protein